MTFREDLLDGCRIAFAGGDGAAIVAELRRLGAWVDSLGKPATLHDEGSAAALHGEGSAAALDDEDAAAAWIAERLPLNGLVFDAGTVFAAGGEAGLRLALEQAWIAARAVATGALIGSERGGRLVFIAPRSDAGTYAHAARAALENLVRTLSVEWARFGVTAVAIAPGSQTTGEELGKLLCFLLSDAGGYYTGCRFELGAVADARNFISAS